jgi:Domain of unknown function (DUF6265)
MGTGSSMVVVAGLLVVLGAVGQRSEPSGANALAWMSGSWGGTVNGVEMEEHWSSVKGETLIGMHRDVRGGRTTGFEFLRVEVRGGVLTYVAMPGGRAPATTFPVKELGASRVVFENLEHDFPQRIIYWRDGADLRARIEGPREGRIVAEEWRWSQLPRQSGQ